MLLHLGESDETAAAGDEIRGHVRRRRIMHLQDGADYREGSKREPVRRRRFRDEWRDEPADRGGPEGGRGKWRRSRRDHRCAATATRGRADELDPAGGGTGPNPATDGICICGRTTALRRNGAAAGTHTAYPGRDFEPGGTALRAAGGGGN